MLYLVSRQVPEAPRACAISRLLVLEGGHAKKQRDGHAVLEEVRSLVPKVWRILDVCEVQLDWGCACASQVPSFKSAWWWVCLLAERVAGSEPCAVSKQSGHA